MANSNESTIWGFLKSKGLSDGAAAGVMGNLDAESGFNPGITNSIGAFGIAQWLGSRKTAEANYAASKNEPANSLDAELNYLWKEMSSGSYGSVEAMNNMDPSSAALYFMNEFEKPGDNSGGTRASDAATIYNKYNGQGGTYTPTAADLAGSGSGSSSGPQAFSKNNDIISALDQSLQIKDFKITNPVGSIAQDAGAISLRIVLTLVGLLVVAFGLFAIVERVK